MHSLFHSSAAIIATASVCAFGAIAQDRIDLDVRQGRPIVKSAYLNGQGPYRFLLDTGAETNQIHAKLAAELGWIPTFRVELATVNGTLNVPGCRTATVRVSRSEARDQEFLLTNLLAVRAMGKDIDGVLGQEFLKRFDYLLDFRGRALIIGSDPIPGERIPVQWLDRFMLIPTSEGPLVLDSGTDALILFKEQAAVASRVLSSAASFTAVNAGTNHRLDIGRHIYNVRNVAFIRSADTGRTGLLPASLFRAIYISNSAGFVVPLN